MANLDDVINEALKDIVKHCKTQDDFNQLFKELKRQGWEAALSGELTDHLGNNKNQRSNRRKLNSRNGYSSNIIQTS